MIKVNFAGETINKPGFFAYAWWDIIWRRLSRKKHYSDDQVNAFLKLTDTFIRLEMHEERLWRRSGRK